MATITFITGGNRGIGLEAARQLGRQGHTILLGSRDRAKGQAAVDQLTADGITAYLLVVDVARPETFRSAVQQIQQEFGRLDVLVNNAGIQIEDPSWQHNTTETVSLEVMRQTFDVNFFGVVALTQQLLPLLRKSPAGRIVNVSSIMGSMALHADLNNAWGGTKPLAYDASKAALNQLTLHLAYALKDTSIKVNSAHPGWVKTDMGSEYAPMEISDGAKTLVQLATLDANGPTGTFQHLGEAVAW